MKKKSDYLELWNDNYPKTSYTNFSEKNGASKQCRPRESDQQSPLDILWNYANKVP